MTYKLIENHDDGVTLSAIAEAFGVTEFGKGMGYYQLIKTESVSSKKGLVLWQNKFISNDVSFIRERLGVSANQQSISPSNVPVGMKLFVQSTSPNRKISSASAVLFYLDTDEEEEEEEAEDDVEEEDKQILGEKSSRREEEMCSSSSSSKTARMGGGESAVPMLVKFDLLKQLKECDEDGLEELGEEVFINGDVGVLFEGVDESPPREVLNASLYHFNQLLLVEWCSVDIHEQPSNGYPENCTHFIDTVCAYGHLPHSETLFRFEYYAPANGDMPAIEYAAVSREEEWGCVIATICDHPSVMSREIRTDCSDGSGPYMPLIPLPHSCSDQQKMSAIIAHITKMFFVICTMNTVQE